MNFDNMLGNVAQGIMPVILLPNGLYGIPTLIYPQWNNNTPSGLTFYFGSTQNKISFVAGTWDTSTYYYDDSTDKWEIHMLY